MEWTQSREGDLGLGGTCAFVACLHVALHVSQRQRFACDNCTFAQGSCLYAPHPLPPYGAGEILPALKLLCLPGFRPYACMFACICCCLCFLLPIRSRKSVPCCRFALCNMNLFMCFVLPSLLLSKSRPWYHSLEQYPLMPAPDVNGVATVRPLNTSECKAWMRLTYQPPIQISSPSALASARKSSRCIGTCRKTLCEEIPDSNMYLM